MPLLAGQWTDAIGQLLNENFFSGVVLFHNGNSANNYAELIIQNDATGQSLKPLESVLENAYAEFLLEQAQETALANDRAGIIAKAELAVQFIPDLKKLLNKLLDHDIASASLNIRFEDIAQTIQDPLQISSAFRNRFNAALLAEQNIDIASLIGGILTLLPAQRRIYLTYLRIFLNQYITLALFGTLD